nr:sigma-70 family RNA polymerase sigma factor [Galbitalea soli]
MSRRYRRAKKSRGTFDWYQPLLAAVPLLDVEGTIEAAKSIEVGLFARERLSKLDPAQTPRQDLIDLYSLAERGELEYEKLLLSNVRLVFHWAKPMANSVGADWVQDAFQVGFMGLMRGIQGWDFRQGFTLSTYVSWHIRQTIQRWRANETDLIRLPVHVTDKLKSASHELSAQIQEAVTRSRQLVPLDLLDLKEAGSRWDGGLEEVLESVFRRRALDQLLNALPEQERRVLRLRTGYQAGGEPRTLEEIGQIFGVTRERIRQIEKKALERSRKLLQHSM